jgi:tellurite methyltransferase
MTSDAERWNTRYRDPKWTCDQKLNPFVMQAIEELGDGAGLRSLDLAGGTGRHALELAARGWEVEVWDISEVGLEILGAKCAERDVEITCRLLDLIEPLPPAAPFDLVLVVNYLDRRIYAELQNMLAPGGHALVTTFTQECEMGLTASRCLEPGELAGALPGLHAVLQFEADGRAGILARRDLAP